MCKELGQGKSVITTPEQWCRFYDVQVVDGIALLSKNVGDDYNSNRYNPNTKLPVNYSPGTIPVADDWDGGVAECGGGLHFSPNHEMAGEFQAPNKRLVCPVSLKDMAIHLQGDHPNKCKARGCCEPVWEVCKNGRPKGPKNKKIAEAFFQKHPLTNQNN